MGCEAGVAGGYMGLLREMKGGVQEEQLRMVMAVNWATVALYWDIGLMLLERQDSEGWGVHGSLAGCGRTFWMPFRICNGGRAGT